MSRITKCYNWRNKLNADGKAAIDIRIAKGKDRKYIPTGYVIEPRYWDEKKHEVKRSHPQASSINARLNQLVYQYEQREVELINTGKAYSLDDFFEADAARQNFEDFCEWIITERRSGVSDKHKSLFRLVISEVVKLKRVRNFTIRDLDLDFLYKYQNSLMARKLNAKTVNKRLQVLAMFVGEAVRSGVMKRSEDCFLDFRYLKETESERYIPTSEEVAALEKLDLSFNEELDLVRDLFVFNCYVGLRNADLLNLTYDNLTETDGDVVISLVERKTKKLNRRLVNVLGFGKGVRILQKYRGRDAVYLFPRLTDKKIRDGVVMLRNIIKAKTPFTFYGSRHYCLTDLGQRGMAAADIKEFAKHSDLRTTQTYLHAQGMDKRLREMFGKGASAGAGVGG